MARLARRLAPAAALGGLAVVIVGVADPALAGRTGTTATGMTSTAAAGTSAQPQTAQPESQGSGDTTPTTPTCADGDQVTGDEVMTRWGPVQVSATVAGGQVCQVQGVEWPTGDGQSQMISAYAIPQLDAMASASPTQFDYVSGATYTSQGYHDSLQSILDSL
jgi:uncharacterized protein with FMN-binding domain